MRYLIITYLKKADGQIDESMTVVKNLRDRDLQTGSIILDFKKLQVVKSSFMGEAAPKEWDRVVQYYHQYYEATIERLFHENGWEVIKPEPQEEAPVESVVDQASE